ncbi:MAG: lysylphosphatidylglycerol synthase transmembrane domain-containing protein [Rhodospirillales bacterium]
MNRCLPIIKLVFSLSILAGAITLLDWNTLTRAFVDIDPALFLLACGVLLLEFPILGLRWYLLIRREVPASWLRHLAVYHASLLFSSVTPGQVGGDIYRVVSLKGERGRAAVAAAVFRERLVGLQSYMAFYVACYVWLLLMEPQILGRAEGPLGLLALCCFAGVVSVALAGPLIRFFKPQRFLGEGRLSSILTDFTLAFVTPYPARDMALVFLASLAGGCVLWTTGVQIMSVGLGGGLGFVSLGMIAVIVDVLRLVPLTIQGIGVREASFSYFFFLLGQDAESGFVLGALAYVAAQLALVMAGCVGHLLMRFLDRMTLDSVPLDGDAEVSSSKRDA